MSFRPRVQVVSEPRRGAVAFTRPVQVEWWQWPGVDDENFPGVCKGDDPGPHGNPRCRAARYLSGIAHVHNARGDVERVDPGDIIVRQPFLAGFVSMSAEEFVRAFLVEPGAATEFVLAGGLVFGAKKP